MLDTEERIIRKMSKLLSKYAVHAFFMCSLIAFLPLISCAEEKQNSVKENYLLHDAVRNNNIGKVNSLISDGYNVNVQRPPLMNTALDQAVFYGHQEIVNALLEAGANPNILDKKGRNSLGRLLNRHNKKDMQTQIAIFKLLLGANANIYVEDWEKRSVVFQLYFSLCHTEAKQVTPAEYLKAFIGLIKNADYEPLSKDTEHFNLVKITLPRNEGIDLHCPDLFEPIFNPNR